MKLGIISSRANSVNAPRNSVCENVSYINGCFAQTLKALAVEGEESDVTIISGGGAGPEDYAKGFAEDHLYQYSVIPPRTRNRGPMAFPERNTTIISLSDALCVFWGGEDMYIARAISEAMFMRKPVFIFPI